MAPKQSDTMKQSKLDFTAGKRTASTAAAGKAKTTTSRTKSTQPPPVVESSPKISNLAEDAANDEIEAAEDLGGSDSETVSSVSTWETLEEKKDSAVPKTPTKTAATTTARTTRSATKKATSEATAKPPAEPTPEIAKSVFKPSNSTDEQIAKTVEANSLKVNEESLSDLRVKAVKYRKYHDELKEKLGDMPTIHGENENKVHQILRFFDNAYEYGPCVGVSRRERWDRAQALGLNPPKEVDEILNTIQGRTLTEYSESVFYGQV